MHSRNACAAAVMAVFALGTTSVMAQQHPEPNRHHAPRQAKPAQGKYHTQLQRDRAARHARAPGANPAGARGFVSATAYPTAVDRLTSDVQVLPTYYAERNLSPTTPFFGLGGIQTLSHGTPGSDSGLSIRGAAREETLVLIDGFRVSSASGADFSLLPISYGNRTEILRGPGSATYGQNAGGGVVHLLSDAAGPRPHIEGEAGIGGRGYMAMRGRLSAGNDVITGRVDLGRERGDGFDVSTSDAPFAENDQDGWKRDNMSGRLDARLSTATHVTVLAMRNTVNADYDGGNALTAKKRLELAGVKGTHELTPDTVLDAKIGQSSVNRTYNRTNSATFDKTKLREYGLGGTHAFSRDIKARLGIDRLEESVDSVGFNSPTRSTNSINAVGEGRFDQHLINAGLRFDDSNRYKHTTSYHLGYAFQMADNLRLSTNFGTGYRAPDLVDYYASPESNRLKQQRDQTIDIGAQWQPDRTSFVKAVLYRTRMRDRLTAAGECNTDLNCSIFNVGRATVRGLALSLGQDTDPGRFTGLRWQANLDLLNPKNNLTGRQLPNVAKRVLSGSVDYGLDERFSVGTDFVLTNRHFSDEANQQRVGGYLVVNLRTAWRATPEITIHGDIYNLGNRSYHTYRNYNQQSRTMMLGVSYKPKLR